MAGFAEYENYDALGLAALVKRHEVAPVELLDAALERAAARNPLINAITIPVNVRLPISLRRARQESLLSLEMLMEYPLPKL